MKKFRILALVLACVMMIGMCVGCTSANDITVTLKFVLNDGSEFVTYELKVNAETPTVELAVNEANATYPDLGAAWSDRYELSIAGYPDTQLEDGTFMYWVFTVNGEEATSKANEATIKDGDVITYTYTAYKAEEEA
ncbi:MAG: DUF4430 domain-containing protein [Clostridia bacterium]|jgi:hypothetical protein|nr:DUF4430 domain-containing protein [Clostridia bacterium]